MTLSPPHTRRGPQLTSRSTPRTGTFVVTTVFDCEYAPYIFAAASRAAGVAAMFMTVIGAFIALISASEHSGMVRVLLYVVVLASTVSAGAYRLAALEVIRRWDQALSLPRAPDYGEAREDANAPPVRLMTSRAGYAAAVSGVVAALAAVMVAMGA